MEVASTDSGKKNLSISGSIQLGNIEFLIFGKEQVMIDALNATLDEKAFCKCLFKNLFSILLRVHHDMILTSPNLV